MIKTICLISVAIVVSVLTTLWFGYQTKNEGTLHLKNARGTVTI